MVLNDAGWDPDKTRCSSLEPGQTVYPEGVPVPADFYVTDPGPTWAVDRANMTAGDPVPDGQTITPAAA